MTKKIKGYQARKAAGKCVRAGCKRKPKLGKDGKPRSYCPFHNAQNRKNSEAWKARQNAKTKPKKAVRKPKAAPVTPSPVVLKEAV